MVRVEFSRHLPRRERIAGVGALSVSRPMRGSSYLEHNAMRSKSSRVTTVRRKSSFAPGSNQSKIAC